MHIAIDARTINSSTGRYIERLLYYLQKIDKDNQYSVLLRKKDLNFWVPTANNFSVVEADFKNFSFGEQIGLKQLLDRINPDVVHFCMPQQPILYKGKGVTTVHDLTLLRSYASDKNWVIYHLKQAVGKLVFRRIMKTSFYIITDTLYTKKDLIDTYGLDSAKVAAIHLAAEQNVSELTPYPQPFKNFILYVGQQPDYKNIRRLGDAHQQLLSKYPDLGLILVGRKAKDVRNNETYFTSRNYKNILFTDFIADSQKDWLYTQASAYVFPSLMEGFGLPGLEAMVGGAPVVSSKATCLPEVYGDAAHYFDPNSTDDIARAIDEVLSSDSLRHSLIAAGHEQVKKYSWRRAAEQTHKTYLKALGSTSSSEQ